MKTPRLLSQNLLCLLLICTCMPNALHSAPQQSDGSNKNNVVIIGSKRFTESYVLGEIARKVLVEAGFEARHRQGMGGNIIVWEALRSGAIDVYPDYTGTIQEIILKAGRTLSTAKMRKELAAYGVGMTGELGFNNTYAIITPRRVAEKFQLRKISDLKHHPELRVGVGHEFLDREDGWWALSAFYGLNMQSVRGIEHALGYNALINGEIDLMDAYSTDAKLAEYDLVVLEDDLQFFPRYNAVFLYRLDLPAAAIEALSSLEGTIDQARMVRLNAMAERTRDYTQAAALYFSERGQTRVVVRSEGLWDKLLRWTLRHLLLVGVSMLLAIAIGIPLGIRASRPGVLSQIILGASGIIQTIPALALLALLVPVPYLGISITTAIVALFLYSLLPIVRNTAAGLQNITPAVRESAAALGLEPRAQLLKVFLPMASRTILAGIKTSAVINVGTATLAALIGAGGLGEPIISGLALNDAGVILQGAVPAALLAILVQMLFEVLDRLLIPKGLRLAGATAR